MNCAQLRELSLDFVYDELSPDQRAAVQAHADGCPACSAELASLQGTLRSARTALRGVLDEPPPPGVRTRLHALAQEHIASGAQQGPLQRLWHVLRRPWLLPVLAAATAVVIGLSRQLSPQRGPHSDVEEVALKDTDQAAPEEPAASAYEVYPPAAEPEVATQRYAPAPRAAQARPAPRAAEAFPAPARRDERLAAPAPAMPTREEGAMPDKPSKSAAARDDLAPSTAAAPAAEMRASEPSGSAAAAARPRAASAAAPAAAVSSAAADDGAAAVDTQAKRSMGAVAKAKRDVRRSAYAEPPAEAAASTEGVSESSGQAPAAPPVPASPRSARPVRTKASNAASGQERDVGALADPATPSDNARAPGLSTAGALDKKQAGTLAVRMTRAHQAFVEQRWTEAAVAYRELLRDYPTHRAVGVWKQRLQAAEAARAQ